MPSTYNATTTWTVMRITRETSAPSRTQSSTQQTGHDVRWPSYNRITRENSSGLIS